PTRCGADRYHAVVVRSSTKRHVVTGAGDRIDVKVASCWIEEGVTGKGDRSQSKSEIIATGHIQGEAAHGGCTQIELSIRSAGQTVDINCRVGGNGCARVRECGV